MISFIVPAHNEEALLGETLSHIQAAACALGELYELIVVDDDSTDRTASIAAEQGARVVSVKLRHIAAVRNAGAKEARGELLFFIDADTQISPRTLAAAWRSTQAGSTAGGALVEMTPPIPFSGRIALTLWNTISRTLRFAAGCFVFVKREAFEAVGGFNAEFFAAEEIALSVALHRCGPFTILPHHVRTSARKLQTHTAGMHLRTMALSILTLGRSLRKREGLDIWYGQQRVNETKVGDPESK
ncbi:MAG: glycosyltransferase [Planctomycetes bacterium]|nr:glycosyltransferase [Planctomycetota bacterium]